MSQANPARKHDDCSESLSRLIDGELDDGACRALLMRLEQDADARRTWVLLNVACDAVRSSETAALHSTRFAARMHAALEAEAVVLSPGALQRRRVLFRRVALPAAAVAAAAVMLAVVAVPQLRGVAPATPEMAKATAPATVSAPQRPEDMERSPALEAYLEAHRDNATGFVSSRSGAVLPATVTTEPR